MKSFVVVLEETKSKTRYTITYEGLRRALNIDQRIDIIFTRISELQDEFIEFLKPKAKLELLSLIRNKPNLRTGEINKFCFNNTRSVYHAFYRVFEELQRTDEIIGTSHGKGKQRTWKIKEV